MYTYIFKPGEVREKRLHADSYDEALSKLDSISGLGDVNVIRIFRTLSNGKLEKLKVWYRPMV